MSTMRVVPPIGLTQLVAAEVRAEMARQQITQVQLSRTIGMSQQSLSERLRGKTPFTTADLEKVAGALRVHPAELLGGGRPADFDPGTRATTTGRSSGKFVTSREVSSLRVLPAQSVAA